MSFNAFAEGFLRSVQAGMDRNAEDRRAQRAALVDHFMSAIDQYKASRTQAAQTLELEQMYANMGIPRQVAALAAYEGISPSEVGAYARRFAVTGDGQVQEVDTGRTVDVARMTGMVPDLPDMTVASTPAQGSPFSETQAALQAPAGGLGAPAMPEDNRSFIGRLMGAPDMGADMRAALSDVANIYGVDPQDIWAMINAPTGQPLPDTTGLRAKSDIELAKEEIAAGVRGRPGGRGGRQPDFSSTEMNRAIAAVVPDITIGPNGEIRFTDPSKPGNENILALAQQAYINGYQNSGMPQGNFTAAFISDLNNKILSGGDLLTALQEYQIAAPSEVQSAATTDSDPDFEAYAARARELHPDITDEEIRYFYENQ